METEDYWLPPLVPAHEVGHYFGLMPHELGWLIEGGVFMLEPIDGELFIPYESVMDYEHWLERHPELENMTIPADTSYE